MSLYEQIGGEAAVEAAVDLFYRKVLRDPSLNIFFDDTDMAGQRQKQKAFLTMVFGGPNSYTGKDLRQAHRHLVEQGMNEIHFNSVAAHLADTLKELEVDQKLIDEVMAIAGSTKRDVLNL